jgi:probable phosphoglycerate mutase
MIKDMEFELYLIRHGQSETNVNPDMMGQSPDVPLTKLGKRQAELLGKRLEKENKKFDFVFTSPYKRAYDTAKIATGEDTTLIKSPRLREYSAGDWTGVSRKETINIQHVVKMGALNHNFLPPNGESLSMVERRASEWLEDCILYNSEMQKASEEKKAEGKVLTIAAFSHGMTIKTLLHYVMGFDKNFTWKVSISNTSISQLYFGKNGWGLGSINDFGHLLDEDFDIYSPEVKNGS